MFSKHQTKMVTMKSSCKQAGVVSVSVAKEKGTDLNQSQTPKCWGRLQPHWQAVKKSESSRERTLDMV